MERFFLNVFLAKFEKSRLLFASDQSNAVHHPYLLSPLKKPALLEEVKKNSLSGF